MTTMDAVAETGLIFACMQLSLRKQSGNQANLRSCEGISPGLVGGGAEHASRAVGSISKCLCLGPVHRLQTSQGHTCGDHFSIYIRAIRTMRVVAQMHAGKRQPRYANVQDYAAERGRTASHGCFTDGHGMTPPCDAHDAWALMSGCLE